MYRLRLQQPRRVFVLVVWNHWFEGLSIVYLLGLPTYFINIIFRTLVFWGQDYRVNLWHHYSLFKYIPHLLNGSPSLSICHDVSFNTQIYAPGNRYYHARAEIGGPHDRVMILIPQRPKAPLKVLSPVLQIPRLP